MCQHHSSAAISSETEFIECITLIYFVDEMKEMKIETGNVAIKAEETKDKRRIRDRSDASAQRLKIQQIQIHITIILQNR